MAKRIILLALISLFSFAFVNLAHAYTYTYAYDFSPTPSDLNDLAHAKYYTWGINWVIPEGQYITEATLTIKNIYDWKYGEVDNLYTHLLDNPAQGVKTGTDNEGGGDNFAGQGELVGNWSDGIGGSSQNFDLVYTFSTLGLLDELTDYLNTAPTTTTYTWKGKTFTITSANFGFGFDPDCHYRNDGITFTITTAATPEPASISLLGLGLLGIFGLKRKK